MPRFLDKKKTVLFVFFLVVLLFVMFNAYYAIKVYYFDPNYSDSYNVLLKQYAQLSFLERVNNFPVFLSKSILFLAPTALLLMLRFYKKQQKFLKLSEQKKIAELTALKNQLNPHFLFNTLNNLYALAIKKSDVTPEVIERLSSMLDYMLYRCNEKFVLLKKEIELLENYLALEKIRYGKRVSITLENNIKEDIKIGPLILLTFVENAFKHGVSQELKRAKIDIFLEIQDSTIVFSIFNTKPNDIAQDEYQKDEALGIKNVTQQLELLYPNAYDLQMNDAAGSYSVLLKLNQK
jgi:LytS/YehU family sensor histidine kinase